MAKRLTGTREWAQHNVNCVNGCAHNCRYCYARAMAGRFQRIPAGGWQNETVNDAAVAMKRKHHDGVTMFPTTHDITPANLDACTTVLLNLVASGNRVLIVSKPHLSCIHSLTDTLTPWQRSIFPVEFRFTIGCDDDALLKYWEPGAPSFGERLQCLRVAFTHGYATSVSMEPMLDAPNALRTFHLVKPFCTEGVWIGKMNRVRSRVAVVTVEDSLAVARIEDTQDDSHILRLYNALRSNPAVRWKDSIKKVVGLP